MNRRGFLGLFGAMAAGAVLDPERLLWEPGKKLISVPKLRPLIDIRIGDIFTIAGRYACDPRTHEIAMKEDPDTGEMRPLLQRFAATNSVTVRDPLDIPRWPYEIERGSYQNISLVPVSNPEFNRARLGIWH